MVDKRIFLLLLLILSNLVTGFVTYEDKTTVSRIVGETPQDITDSLLAEDMAIPDASYYSTNFDAPLFTDTTGVTKELMQIAYSDANVETFPLSEEEVDSSTWKKNELVIFDSLYETEKGVGLNFGQLGIQFFEEAAASQPFIILNSYKSGDETPLEDDIIDHLTDSVTIATSGKFDMEFSKALSCSIFASDNNDPFEIYRRARNRYYDGIGIYSSGYFDSYDISYLFYHPELIDDAILDILDGDNADNYLSSRPEAEVLSGLKMFGAKRFTDINTAYGAGNICKPYFYWGDFDGYS